MFLLAASMMAKDKRFGDPLCLHHFVRSITDAIYRLRRS